MAGDWLRPLPDGHLSSLPRPPRARPPARILVPQPMRRRTTKASPLPLLQDRKQPRRADAYERARSLLWAAAVGRAHLGGGALGWVRLLWLGVGRDEDRMTRPQHQLGSPWTFTGAVGHFSPKPAPGLSPCAPGPVPSHWATESWQPVGPSVVPWRLFGLCSGDGAWSRLARFTFDDALPGPADSAAKAPW